MPIIPANLMAFLIVLEDIQTAALNVLSQDLNNTVRIGATRRLLLASLVIISHARFDEASRIVHTEATSNHNIAVRRIAQQTRRLLRAVDDTDDGQSAPEMCSICLEPIRMAGVLPCGHAFDAECIGLWLREHNSCPLCRRQVFAGDVA